MALHAMQCESKTPESVHDSDVHYAGETIKLAGYQAFPAALHCATIAAQNREEQHLAANALESGKRKAQRELR